MTDSEDFVRTVENQFTDDKMGRTVRVIREIRDVDDRRFIEIQDEEGSWKNFEELRDLISDEG